MNPILIGLFVLVYSVLLGGVCFWGGRTSAPTTEQNSQLKVEIDALKEQVSIGTPEQRKEVVELRAQNRDLEGRRKAAVDNGNELSAQLLDVVRAIDRGATLAQVREIVLRED